MIKTFVRQIFRFAGLEAFRRKTMSRGIVLDYDLQRLFSRKPPSTIIDAGANIGQTTLRFKKLFPQATIFAFEPVRSTFQTLVENVGGIANIKPQNIALGSGDGDAHMAILAQSGWNRVVEGAAIESCASVEQVVMRRLDGFCRDEALEYIDILKTDCEGHDLQVLAGAEGPLRNRKIACIYCEINFLRDNQVADFFAIENYLRRFGYKVFALYDYSGWQQDVLQYGFANAMFVCETSDLSFG